MNLELLAILGIAVFGFMAIATSFNAVRSIKRMTRRTDFHRIRRLVRSPDLARSTAQSVVREVASENSLEVQKAAEQGRLTPELEQALAEAETYFLSRVESKHRALFTQAVDEIILKANSNTI
ncbi:MAG: hypothetical protein GY847_35580 [Proteobacteria bacterium]|nr:hypothetical protein [Pseudomonadota bacterium]